ncbi:hypothetical protein BH11BAC4_BH11BAC4_20280 [soil metagenome]
MNKGKIYIILTGVHERKVFDLYNILKKHHTQYELLLFDYKDTSFSLPVVYTKKIYKLPNDNYPHFETALFNPLNAYKGNTFIYIPLLDNYNGLFYQFIQTHPGLLSFLLPDIKSFNTTINKIQFQLFCENNQLPVPASFTKKDTPFLQQHFKPLIIKPNTGAGSVGISFINNAAELSLLESLDFENYLVQERIDNINVEGAFFLMHKGELVSYYGHKRIRVFPETGGVTVYSEYQYQEPLKKIGAELLKKLNWDGIAMVEFLYDAATNDFKIIEVNPRLWGSFMLGEFAQTGIIENYLNICLQQPVKHFDHRTGTRIRWFYPFDILLYVKRKGKIKDFWKLDRSNTCYINFTYAGFIRSLIYMTYFTFNINSIKRFYKKLGTGNTSK